MAKTVGKALLLGLSLFLGAVVGTWLSLATLYWLLEPGHRVSDAPFIFALAALLLGLVLVVRRMFGSAGLVPLAITVLLAAAAGVWMLS